MKRILAADIGGTNSRFACFELGPGNRLELVETQWLKTSGASSFGSLIKELLSGGFPLSPADADISVIAVAGPVGFCLPWAADA